MTSRFAQWTLDVHELDTMATFWSQALGYRVAYEPRRARDQDRIRHPLFLRRSRRILLTGPF